MSSQLNLENLSNREIKVLWEKTRNEQRKQVGLREAQARANADAVTVAESKRETVLR